MSYGKPHTYKTQRDEARAKVERLTQLCIVYQEERRVAQTKVDELTGAWKDSIDGVHRIASDMEPPNISCSRLIMWVNQMRNELNRIKAGGRVMDKEEADLVHALTAQVESLQAKVDEQLKYIESSKRENAWQHGEITRLTADKCNLRAKVDELEPKAIQYDRLSESGVSIFNKKHVESLQTKVDELTAALKAIRAGQAGDPVICATNALKQEVESE